MMKRVRAVIRVTELDTLVDVLLRLYKAYAALATDAYLKSIMEEAEAILARLTTSIRSDKTSSKLDEADSKRDEIIHLLFALISGYVAIPVAKKKAAAEKIAAVTAKYKGIAGESYATESALIKSMLEDLSAAALAEDIESLEGVADYIEALRTAQDEFNKASDEFTAANTGKSESATALKKPLLAVVNDKFVPYVSAMALANNELYGEFAAKAEAEIAKMNDLVIRRTKQQPQAVSQQADSQKPEA